MTALDFERLACSVLVFIGAAVVSIGLAFATLRFGLWIMGAW